MSRTLSLFFDGLTEPVNPGGWGCYGFAILGGASIIDVGYGCMGKVYKGKPITNNVCEYAALVFGLQRVREHQHDRLCVFGDSKLVVEQVNGNWQVRAEHLQAAKDRCLELLTTGKPWSLEWIPREENVVADQLSNVAYREARNQPTHIRDILPEVLAAIEARRAATT